MRYRYSLFSLALLVGTLTRQAHAQQSPSRDDNWKTVSTVSLIIGAGTELVMPRFFYSDPEATVGWKSRWHVSVLASAMTLTSLAVLNEYGLKDEFKGYRPGCSAKLEGSSACHTYGMLSTHAFGSFAALGQGGAVFLFDTLKWSDGRFNAGGFVGHVAVPLVASVFTAIGRDAGNFETTKQVLAGAGVGLVSGFLTGAAYALMQRPECGYTGSLICW
jgi:hypothetical protein